MGVEIKNEVTSRIDTDEGRRLSAGQRVLVQIDNEVLIDYTIPDNIDAETGVNFRARLWGELTVAPEVTEMVKTAIVSQKPKESI